MISKIRSKASLDIIPGSKNRHCILIHEKDATAAYFSSAPIYNAFNGKPAVPKFEKYSEDVYFLEGTNCSVYIRDDSILFKTVGDTVRVNLPKSYSWLLKHDELIGENIKLTATTNGVALYKTYSDDEKFEVCIIPAKLGYELRSNSKYFAIMKQKFTPTFSISSICVYDSEQKPHPLMLNTNLDTNTDKYRLTFSSADIKSGEMLFEMNMYEPKLIQDTTVERKHPDENNAYGSTAFIGYSKTFGEQTLYLKFDYPRFGELNQKKLMSAKLWIPIIGSDATINAYAMENRFCSFGSTWNNRKQHSNFKLEIEVIRGFCCIDLSQIMIEKSGKLIYTNGIMLEASSDRTSEGTYLVTATGDSYLFSPILEIRYLS